MIAALLLLSLAAPIPSTASSSAVVERRVAMMGTTLHLRVEAADRPTALQASERAVRALEATEARLSTWREDSELSRLNQAKPGEPIALSSELAAELSAARACWLESTGAFDPTVGALAAAWGLRDGGREPSETERAQALEATGMDELELEGDHAIKRRPGLVLEEGAFGKGAGLSAALDALASARALSATLDLGGQLAVLGAADRQDPARFAVADPRDRSREVLTLELARGSVATSGNSERGIVAGGHERGHLLDPRTGRPAADFGSLTVWTDDPLRADCLSTGLYVLGPDAALDWARRQPGVEVLVLTPSLDGHRLIARATPGLAATLHPLVENLDLQMEREHEGATATWLRGLRAAAPRIRTALGPCETTKEYTCRP